MKSLYDQNKKVVPVEIGQCSEDNWEETEQSFIKEYKEKGYELLNIDKGGRGVVTKEKRSKSSLERCGEKHRKPVIAFNLDGSFSKEYNSITIATESFGGNDITNIINVLSGTAKSAYGYLWKYKKDCTDDIIKNGIPQYKVSRHSKKIYQFNFAGDLIKIYDAIIDIIDELGGSYNGIRSAINKKKVYNNTYWSYCNTINPKEFEKLFNYTVEYNGETKSFKYQKEVADFMKCAKVTISKYLEISNPFKYNGFKVTKL